MLMVGRIMQGISGGLAWTVSLILVVDTVDPQSMGQALGWLGTATSLGILVAPLLGGVVFGTGGYYSVFAMCFGLLAVDIVMRLLIIESREAKVWLSQIEAATQVDQANVEQGRVLQNQPQEEVAKAEGGGEGLDSNNAPMVAPAAEGVSQAPTPAPKRKSPFYILRRPRLLAALWGTFAQAIVGTAFDSTLPLFVSSTFGWGSTGGGLIFLPFVLPSFLSPVIGALSDKYGPKWLCAVGFALAAPFLVCLRFVTENSIQHKVMLCGLLAGTGVAYAMVFGPLMAEITWSVQDDTEHQDNGEVDEEHTPYALAYGLYAFIWAVGAIVGPLMGGLIRDKAGFGTVGWSMAVVALVTAVTQAIWVGGPLTLKPRQGTSQE